jgi:hypothetical protein
LSRSPLSIVSDIADEFRANVIANAGDIAANVNNLIKKTWI